MIQKPSVKAPARTVALLVLLLLGTGVALAQAPTGQFTNSIALLPLWDFGGTYVMTNNCSSVSLKITHHANGQITGLRTETFSNAAGIFYEGSAPDNGRVTSSAKGAGLLTSWKETIHGTAGGAAFVGTRAAHGKWSVVPGLLTLQNEGTCRTCIGGHCESKTAAYQVLLPAGMTGNWNLEIAVRAQGNTLTGNGLVALSNGRALNYTLKGRYNPTTQISTLHWIGLGETRGTAMVTTFTGPQMTLKTLTGTVLGQKLKYR